MQTMDRETNVVLIGMPGVGKSTVGVLLAKVMAREFIDTDVCLQGCTQRRLQEIIDTQGLAAFRAIEERHILTLECRHHVIATGGSVVYSAPAMDHLKAGGVVVFLDLPVTVLAGRLRNLGTRGVVMEAGQSLESLYAERLPLYRRYADVTLDCRGLTHEGVVDAVVRALGG
jgi:shikimate kinase